MIKRLCFVTLVLFASCAQIGNKPDKSEGLKSDTIPTATPSMTSGLRDTTVKFLWRNDKYDPELKVTSNSIFINEAYCKTITDPERAALGYIATFIGNECNWDGAHTDNRSNLMCKVLTALNLGYQCSEQHLGFLRQWFKNDTKVLEELKAPNCPTTPYGATIQDTFDEITLTIEGNRILVFFKAAGINLREGKSWSWTETQHFQVDNDDIRLIKKDVSPVKREYFDIGE